MKEIANPGGTSELFIVAGMDHVTSYKFDITSMNWDQMTRIANNPSKRVSRAPASQQIAFGLREAVVRDSPKERVFGSLVHTCSALLRCTLLVFTVAQ